MKLFEIFTVIFLTLHLSNAIQEIDDTRAWFSNESCAIRYRSVDRIKKMYNCSKVKQLNSLCARTITIGCAFDPPYVYADMNGKIKGILPDLLQEILINFCCLGCNQVSYKFNLTHNYTTSDHKDYDVFMPIEHDTDGTLYLGFPYAKLLEIKNVLFIGRRDKSDAVNILRLLFEAIGDSWSLFVIVMLLAMCVGTIAWSFETWINKEEFPRSPFTGAFEGFWWAFVSMTTVGYGDRTPRSVPAKILAVFWILFGITLFNILSGKITADLSAKLTLTDKDNLLNEKVGALLHSDIHDTAIRKVQANPIHFKDFDALKDALKKKEVKAIVLESHMAKYFHQDLKSIDSSIGILKAIAVDRHSKGIIADQQIVKLIRSFFTENKDSMDSVLANTNFSMQMKGIDRPDTDDKTEYDHVNRHFYITIAGTFGITLTFLIIGYAIAKYRRNLKQGKAEAIGNNNL